MKDLKKPKLSGTDTGYFQANDDAFSSLVVKGINQLDLPREDSFLKTFDFLPFGVAISESLTSNFFYANKALLLGLEVSLEDFQQQGLQLFNKSNNKNMQRLWKKLKVLISIHKQTSHEPFGCIVRYDLKMSAKRMNVMHNVNEFFPAPGQQLFLHTILPDPEANFDAIEIYISGINFRLKIKDTKSQTQKEINRILSVRESEIFEEVAKGKTSKDISEIFGLSIHTVKFHRKSILKKLKVHNALEAIAKMNV
jgi:DNA-binding CsgD family transcriptional regulator